MKKYKRALASMMMTVSAFVLVMALLIVPLLFARGWLTDTTKDTNMIAIAGNLASLILVILELCAIAIAIIGLHYYFRRYRPSVFIFEGFSNAAKLADIDHVPVDFNNLAREELAYQFRLIFMQLKKYYERECAELPSADPVQQAPPDEGNDDEQSSDLLQQSSSDQKKRKSKHAHPSVNEDQDFEALRPEDQAEWPLPSPYRERQIFDIKKANLLLNCLKKTIDSLEKTGISNIVNAIERNTPKEISPIVNFIDALLPAHTVRVTCYLQWRSKSPDGIGITFEIADSKQEGSFTHALWLERTLKNTTAANAQKMLTERYIELIRPAMRWLTLLFWEQEVKQDTSHDDKKGLLAAFYYLLGAFYEHSIEEFPACSNFFQQQQALDRLCKVTSKYPNRSLPYFYRAERYLQMSKDAKEAKKKDRPWLQKAIDNYDQACNCTPWEKHEQDIKNRIIIRKALAVLGLEDEDRFGKMKMQIEDMTKPGHEGDPATFHSRDGTEDCSLYLSNLASWYVNLARWYVSLGKSAEKEETETKARLYLIYSFIRDQSQWYHKGQPEYRYEEFQKSFVKYKKEFFRDDKGLEILWNLLEEERERNPDLAKQMIGFAQEVDEMIYDPWCERIFPPQQELLELTRPKS